MKRGVAIVCNHFCCSPVLSCQRARQELNEAGLLVCIVLVLLCMSKARNYMYSPETLDCLDYMLDI